MFPDGEYLHDTIKYSAQCITFISIKPKDTIHIKCALDFCDECTEYNIPDEEIYDGKMLHWSILVFIPIKEDM